MKLESKIEPFLASKKEANWLRVFPDYFQDAYRHLAQNLVKKLLEEFTKYAETN